MARCQRQNRFGDPCGNRAAANGYCHLHQRGRRAMPEGTLSCHLTAAEQERFRALAVARGWSVAELLRRIVREWLRAQAHRSA